MSFDSFGKFFLPGPTEVHPDVMSAMARPMIAHRGRDMESLLAGMKDPLKKVFKAEKNVFVGSCAATGFMEMAVRCGTKHRVLSVVGGAFGKRFAAIAGACGRDVTTLNINPGDTVEPDMLRDALKRSEVDSVTLVHSETSTGALAPLQELADVVHEFDDVLLLVDGVTSVAGLPVLTDAWKLDFVFTGAQKAFALPPGIAMGACSDRMLERAETIPERGAYLDLATHVKAFDDSQPTNTPAIPQLFTLSRQLDRIAAEGGIEKRWDRHRDMLSTVESWIGGKGGELGLDYLCREGRRSWTVSCLTLPDDKNGRDIAKQMLERGWTIGSGYGDLKTKTIRIGHMGDHTTEEVEVVLAQLEEVLG